MIETQSKEIVGILIAQGREYEMLDLFPAKHPLSTPWLLKENTFQFLVVFEGFVQTIIVSRDGFVIVPLLKPIEMDVKFLIEDEEVPVPVESDALASVESNV